MLTLSLQGSQLLAPGVFGALDPSVSCLGSVWATVLSPGLAPETTVLPGHGPPSTRGAHVWGMRPGAAYIQKPA